MDSVISEIKENDSTMKEKQRKTQENSVDIQKKQNNNNNLDKYHIQQPYESSLFSNNSRAAKGLFDIF